MQMAEIIVPLGNWLAVGLILFACGLSVLLAKAKFQPGIEAAAKRGLQAHHEIDVIES